MKYKYLDSTYTVVSAGDEYALTILSENGSMHSFIVQGQEVFVELQFSDSGVYGGPVVIFTDNEKYWMRPRFEFFNIFTKVEE
jgi:hypothetical protein